MASSYEGSSSPGINGTLGVGSSDSRPATPGGSLLPHEPVFKVALKDTELKEGTTVRFEIVVRGMPCPNVTFYKNDEPLKQDDRVKVLFENREVFELILEHVRLEDAGEYKCVAINSEGEATSRGKISISKDKVLFQGLDSEEADSQEADSKETDHLTPGTPVRRESRPRSPAFRWYKNGNEFKHTDRFECNFDDTHDTIALVFRHVIPEDAGLYTCVANTRSGKVACSAKLTVKGEVQPLLPAAPSIKTAIVDAEVTEGAKMAMLEAHVLGHPKPTIGWFKKGVEVTPDERHKFLFDDEECYTLVVKNVTLSDAGEYTLRATNHLGQTEAKSSLHVICAPKVLQPLRDLDVVTDKNIELQMEVYAYPPPQLKWFKDGQPMKHGGRFIEMDGKDGLYTFIIEEARLEDSGTYSCIVSNSRGQETYLSNIIVNAPPGFVNGMKSQEVKAGDVVHFEVKVTGNPKPNVQFMKDKNVLKPDGDRIVIEEDNNVSLFRLKIDKVTGSDEGLYSCLVTNMYGSQASEGQLKVKSKPIFARRLNDYEAREGDEEIDFMVQLEASPRAEVRWLYEGSLIREGNGYRMTVDEKNLFYTLWITKVTGDLAGIYTCEAVNNEGKSESKGVLTVLAKPSITQKISDQSVAPDSQLVLRVKVSGNPVPTIKWLKDGSEVRTDETRVIASAENPTTHVLTINRINKEDSGEYTFEISNIFGKVTSVSKITVLSQPEFKAGLKDKDVLENDSDIELKVETEPSLTNPTIRWYVDDIQITDIDSRYQLIPGDNEYRLVIKKAYEGTAGLYKCSASNAFGETTSTAKVTVSSKPVFLEALEDREVPLEEAISMTVVVAGNPKPTMKWLKDGQDISTSVGVKIEKESESVYILTIETMTLEQSGTYECIITNSVGEAKTRGKMTAVDVPPKFVKELERVEFEEGTIGRLETKVMGSPEPSIKWYKDEEELIASEHFGFVQDPDGTVALLIDAFTSEDVGLFKAVATNQAGEDITLAPVKLYIRGQTPVKPEFTEQLNAPEVHVGQTLTLTAKVKGEPKPAIVWLRDGEELAEDFRTRFAAQSDGTVTLTIEKVTPKETGYYKVEATNSQGMAKTAIPVEIQKKPETKPVFETAFAPAALVVGEPGKISLKISGEPAPHVKWLKNGQQVEPDARIHMVEEPEGTASLIFDIVTDNDVGEYTAVAVNNSAEISCSAQVAVKHNANRYERLNGSVGPDSRRADYKLSDEATRSGPALLSKRFGDFDCPEGQTAKFTACVSGSAPQFKWFKDGTPFEPTEPHYQVDVEPNGLIRFSVRNVKAGDAGEYRLSVSNALGCDTCRAQLRLGGPKSLWSLIYDNKPQVNFGMTTVVSGICAVASIVLLISTCRGPYFNREELQQAFISNVHEYVFKCLNDTCSP